MSALALDLLAEASRYGIRLVPTPAGTIKARAPKPPPPDLLARLKAHRAELVAALAATSAAGAPREWAEALARLDPDQPPGDVPPRRWQRLVADAARFLDEWAARAVALGWGPLDLFGCDRDRPFARLDKAGLLWLLNGGRLVMLSQGAASIERPTGTRQTYRRRPSTDGTVLAWEIAP